MAGERRVGARGPGRTTREDWLVAARGVLVSEGVDQVKVLTLSQRLNCARSSFYWYFRDREELLDALVDHWANSNTRALVEAAALPAETIGFALGNLLACWVSGRNFDSKLDFAIRDWARRAPAVRRSLDLSEGARLEAIAAMFRRYDYGYDEADVRAKIVYYTQVGYELHDLRETLEARTARARDYLFCLSGRQPSADEIAGLTQRIYEGLAVERNRQTNGSRASGTQAGSTSANSSSASGVR